MDVRSFLRMAASTGAAAGAGDTRLLDAIEGPISSKARFLLAASLVGDAVLLPVTLVKMYLHMSDGMIASINARVQSRTSAAHQAEHGDALKIGYNNCC